MMGVASTWEFMKCLEVCAINRFGRFHFSDPFLLFWLQAQVFISINTWPFATSRFRGSFFRIVRIWPGFARNTGKFAGYPRFG